MFYVFKAYFELPGDCSAVTGQVLSVGLMQVPENGAAEGLASAVVDAWNLYGKPQLVC